MPNVWECFFISTGVTVWMSVRGISRSSRYSYNPKMSASDGPRRTDGSRTLSFLYMATCPPRSTNHRFFHVFLRSPRFIKYPALSATLSLKPALSLLVRLATSAPSTAARAGLRSVPPIDEASDSSPSLPEPMASSASEMAERGRLVGRWRGEGWASSSVPSSLLETPEDMDPWA